MDGSTVYDGFFDTLDYSQRAQQNGFTIQQAEFQAKELALLHERQITRNVLKHELTNLSDRMQLSHQKNAWVILSGIAMIAAVAETLHHFLN